MSRAAAKKYAKVLIQNTSKDEIVEIKDFLSSIVSLFKDSKFKHTILSPLVTMDEKYEMLLGKQAPKNTLANLIRLLIEKDRIELIPHIYEELRLAQAVESNSFNGFVYSSQELDPKTIDELKNSISKKVNARVDFKQIKSNNIGFKAEVPDLGLEISFSQARLKSQLIQHILRGI